MRRSGRTLSACDPRNNGIYRMLHKFIFTTKTFVLSIPTWEYLPTEGHKGEGHLPLLEPLLLLLGAYVYHCNDP